MDKIIYEEQLTTITGAERLIVLGDLHTDRPNFDCIVETVGETSLKENKTHIVLLGDYFYRLPRDDYLNVKGGELSDYYATRQSDGLNALNLLWEIADLKRRYPGSIHILAGNCELRLKQGDPSRPSTQEFEKMIGFLEESAFHDVKSEMVNIIDGMPLFVIIQVGKRVYYLSHGGTVKGVQSKSDLIKFKKNPKLFDDACYVKIRCCDPKTQQEIVDAVLQKLQAHCMISGHIHIGGAKQQGELPGLGLSVRVPGGVACAHQDKVWVLNSFLSKNYVWALDIRETLCYIPIPKHL